MEKVDLAPGLKLVI